MKIVGARWTSRVNQLTIECTPCRQTFEHPANRWQARCPRCGHPENLGKLREEFQQSGGKLERS